MGLKAKFNQITQRCSKSSNPMALGLNLNKFKFIGDIQCSTENECRALHRLSNVILKRYYINDFGGPAIYGLNFSDILSLYNSILKELRNNNQSPNPNYLKMMDLLDKVFCQQSDIVYGQIYIIDNIKSVKVGASHNAITRFRQLKANGEIYPNAHLMCVYDVYDMFGIEAKSHALLNGWKTQNPLYASNRALGWRCVG